MTGKKNLPANDVERRIAEVEVGRGVVATEQPSRDVGTHFIGNDVKGSRSLRLVHFAAALISHEGVSEQRFERRNPFHHGAHRQQCIEPISELAREALRHEIGWNPVGPVPAVGSIPSGGERDDTGVKPGVPDVGNPLGGCPAVAAGDEHGVHPRTVGAVGCRRVAHELVPAGSRSGLELLPAADDVEPAAGPAFPDGQRQPPVTLLADHPVTHVPQPVQL